jgi:5'-nucleotidase
LKRAVPLLFYAHMARPQILLTNDDGIRSPGLWAAAGSLAALGYVTVAAPEEQSSGMGRSLPSTSTGIIRKQTLTVNGQDWTVHAVSGSPAQAVLHGALEIMPERPSLVVSGINYGENVGLGVTISGTVGAAMEAAALGIPAMAVSLEAAPKFHFSYSKEVDFSAAAHFAAIFGRMLLEKRMPEDVRLLKVDVPSDATTDTPWQVTRVSRQPYYRPQLAERESWEVSGPLSYAEAADLEGEDEDSDVYVLRKKRIVSVTPITLDLTSRVALSELETYLRG